MKPSEIRELSRDELVAKVRDLKETCFNLRFQHETGQLENPRKINQAKKDLARVNTIIREKDLQKADR